ncbi:MAG: radical SAM protein [Candidatus Aminicenantes bacterium]|nr:radical SAM protein [Candidatus Aminicenantes bacterium]
MITAQQLKIGLRFLKYYPNKVRPYEVAAQLWNSCDQRCIYCRCPDVPTQLMTTEQWCSVLRDLQRLGTIRIKFQGGEPTLKPDFLEICWEARKLGMITSTVTNGMRTASKPELLDPLKEVVVSLDSLRPEVNDYMRGEGAFAGATKTIEHALEKGLKTYVNMALCQKNLEDLEAMLAFCEDRGMKMNAQPIKFGVEYYDEGARKLALSPDQIRGVHLQMIEWKKQRRGIMFAAASFRKALDWPDLTLNNIQSEAYSDCMAGKFYFHIDPDGDVIPCIPHGADFTPKNILRDGLYEALRHVRHHNCGDCWSPYLNERKALFKLHPAALIEFFRRG